MDNQGLGESYTKSSMEYEQRFDKDSFRLPPANLGPGVHTLESIDVQRDYLGHTATLVSRLSDKEWEYLKAWRDARTSTT